MSDILVSILRICNFSSTVEKEELSAMYGIGEKLEYAAALENPHIQICKWEPLIRDIASKFGYVVEDITASFEKAITEHDVQVGFGMIEATRVVAARLRTCGIINGCEAIVFDQVISVDRSATPQWPCTDGTSEIRLNMKTADNLKAEVRINTDDSEEELVLADNVLPLLKTIESILSAF